MAQRFPDEPGYVDLDAQDDAHVPRVGRAVEPGRALARRERRAEGRPRRDRAPERVLPALDRRVRRGAQGGRGDGAREHASVDTGDGRDPRPRGDLGDVHVRRVCSSTRARCAPRVPSLRSIVCADGPDARRRSVGTTRSPALDASECQVPVDADDMADIMYTSGTTGLAEGRARAAPQRRDDPERARRTGRAGVGCTARRCSRSRA